MRLRVVVPAVVVAVALVGGGVALARSGGDGPAVQVGEVTRASVTEVVDAPGTVTARASSTVSSPADGTVAALLVPDGTAVTRGTVLARIDSPAAQARLEAARRARASASTRVQVPAADLGPLQDALDEAAAGAFDAARAAAQQVPDPAAQAAALQSLAAAEARYRAAAGAARSVSDSLAAGAAGLGQAVDVLGASSRLQADALLQAAQSTVDALTVTAPIDGVVSYGGTAGAPSAGLSGLLGSLPAGLAAGVPATAPAASGTVAVGAPISAGSPLLTVTDVSGLTVTADVDETDVLLVRVGTPADVELDALPGAGYDASVMSVDVTPTSGSGSGVTYRVRLSLTPGTAADGTPSPQPLPGMSAVVDLRVREAEGAVSVPSAAVVRDGDRDAVFVQEGRGDTAVYRRREVVLGAQGSERVQVMSGLEVGERVVVRDADRLRDGQRA